MSNICFALNTQLAQELRASLEQAGHNVEEYTKEWVDKLFSGNGVAVDVVLLDFNLPDGSYGVEFCQKMCSWQKDHSRRIGLIFLTTRNEEWDVIRALDAGADDYIVVSTPISQRIPELLARVSKVSERLGRQRIDKILARGDILYNVDTQRVIRAGRPVTLRRTQRGLLKLLMESPGRVYERGEIIKILRGRNEGQIPLPKTVDFWVSQLKKSLNRRGLRDPILKHSNGYSFDPDY